jgi:predicted NUDIX family NTP pyrophosphohydrolase
MPKISAGILLFRRRAARIEVLLVHPGGPFWAKKDSGAWSIPKGEVDEAFSSKLSDAALLEVARREFAEELGPKIASQLSSAISSETLLIFLGEIRQKSGKIVHAWAAEGDCDLSLLRSNTFTIEWPPRSGKQREFPEVDRAAFFSLDEARIKLNAAQAEFLERLAKKLDAANEHPQ